MKLFDDPLMRRELSGTARRWQTFAFRMLILGVLAFVLYSFVENFHRSYGYYAGTSDLADLSRSLFRIVFACLMVCLPLQAVAAAADLICREVRNGTLGLLFLTPLTPWRILLGKWKAVMAQVFTVLLAAAPIDAACVFMGGVEAWDLLWSAALPLASAAFAAALALFFSAMLRSSGVVMIASVVALLAGVYLPGLAIDGRGDSSLLYLHPAFAAEALTVDWRPGGGLAEVREYGWSTASLSAFLGALALLRLASWRLRQRVNEVPGPSLLSRLMVRLDAFYESINVGRVRFLARTGGVWETRALLWKELRTRASGKLRHATRLALCLLILMAVMLSGLLSDSSGGHILFLWLVAGLLVLQALIGGVSLFVHEKEGRHWEVLLSTPLTASEIVAAKLGGGLAALGPTALVGALYVAALTFVNRNGLSILATVVIPVGLFALFSYVLSAAASLRCATYRGAFGLSTSILLGILVGVPVVLRFLAALLGTRLRTRDILPHSNPVWYLQGAGDYLRWGYGGGWVDPRLTESLTTYGVLYVGATGAVLLWMLKRFDRLAGRA